MDIVFVTAVTWFLLGFGFHAGLVWYDARQKRKAWHAGMDKTLRKIKGKTYPPPGFWKHCSENEIRRNPELRKQRNRDRVLEAVRDVTRDRQDVAWRN